MDDAKLITLVENCDVLYNKFNKEYRIPEKKRAAWSRISIEMGIAGKYVCKSFNICMYIEEYCYFFRRILY